MPMIKVNELSKFYSGHRAIDNVGFEIEEGEIVGLLGLNGAGKSTILKILGCFLLPSAGEAEISGFSIYQDPHEIRKLIGFLPDSPPLFDEMKVTSYLRFVAKLKNLPSAEVEKGVASAIAKTNLEAVADQKLEELSYGFKQRVSIAQALVHNPKVLIMDEPISGLDPVQIVEVRDLILSLRGKHTVILSSHILSEITKTCDRILVIDRGRLVAQGSEESLQSGMSETMHLTCEVDRFDDSLLDSINGIDGVALVKGREISGAVKVIDVETTSDVRSTVASAIVASGSGLLGMSREGAGLERLFMKLIKNDGDSING